MDKDRTIGAGKPRTVGGNAKDMLPPWYRPSKKGDPSCLFEVSDSRDDAWPPRDLCFSAIGYEDFGSRPRFF